MEKISSILHTRSIRFSKRIKRLLDRWNSCKTAQCALLRCFTRSEESIEKTLRQWKKHFHNPFLVFWRLKKFLTIWLRWDDTNYWWTSGLLLGFTYWVLHMENEPSFTSKCFTRAFANASLVIRLAWLRSTTFLKWNKRNASVSRFSGGN